MSVAVQGPAARRFDVPSLVMLLLANLFPLLGVLLAGWRAGNVVLLYWAENVVIGVFTVLAMASVPTDRGACLDEKERSIDFFCVHYGMFCFGHGVFVISFFKMDFPRALPGLIPWVGVLALNHGLDFVRNRPGRCRSPGRVIEGLFVRPYARIMILHVALIFGGAAIQKAGSPMPLLCLLVGLKTLYSLGASLLAPGLSRMAGTTPQRKRGRLARERAGA